MTKQFLSFLILFILLGLIPTNISKAQDLSEKLSGRILLQVESVGQAWYVDPKTSERAFLGRPADAFRIMRELGLGISEKDYNSFAGYAPSRLSGKILLRVEAKGEAYYVFPDDLKMYYLGRPADAFNLMREKGLGITNEDLNKVSVFQKYKEQIESNTIPQEPIITTAPQIINNVIDNSSNVYKEALQKILATYIKSYNDLNYDANSIILIMNERIGVLRTKSSELNNLSYTQDQIVADMIKNLSSIIVSDIKPLEDKIESIKKLTTLNNSKITSLNGILNTIKKEDFVINDELYKKITDSAYSNDEFLQEANQTLSNVLNDYKTAMQSRDADYKIGWNQILTVADIVYYTPPQYTPPSFSPSYKSPNIKCYFSRDYNGNASSMSCY